MVHERQREEGQGLEKMSPSNSHGLETTHSGLPASRYASICDGKIWSQRHTIITLLCPIVLLTGTETLFLSYMYWTQPLFAKPGKALPKSTLLAENRALCSKACLEPPWGQGRVPDGAGQAWGGGNRCPAEGALPQGCHRGCHGAENVTRT